MVIAPAFIDAGNDGLLMEPGGPRTATGMAYARDLLIPADPLVRLALLRQGVGVVYAELPMATGATTGDVGCIVLTDPEPISPSVLVDVAGVSVRVTGRSQNESNTILRRASLKSIEAGLDGAERYKKTWEEFEKAKKEYLEKLEAFEKGEKPKAEAPKVEAPAQPATERPARSGLPEGFREWPREKQREWMRESMRGGANRPTAPTTDEAKPSSGGGSGRPKPPLTPKSNPSDAAWLRVLKREVALRVEAHWKEDLDGILDLASRRRIRLVILGGTEADRSEKLGSEEGHIFLLGTPATLLRDDLERVGSKSALGRLLDKRGFSIAFRTSGEDLLRYDSLPLLASLHGGEGLARSRQLSAMTMGAAKAIGMQDSLGRVAVGFRAVFQVRQGRELDVRDPVTHMIFGTNVIRLLGER
jgi:hypothetical protein